jgi:integrase/recombinase XerD
MRKKSGFTIVEQAIMLVPEFEKVVHKLDQQVTLRGQSKSTLQNYIRRIALLVVHFGKLPQQIDPEEINEYLVALARDPNLLPAVASSTWFTVCVIITVCLE